MAMDKNRFNAIFDEINPMLTASQLKALQETDGLDMQVKLEKRAEMIQEDVMSYLILAYEAGVQETAKDLGVSADVDPDLLETALFLTIEGKTVFDRIWEDVVGGNAEQLQVLVETETHRMFETGSYDTAERVGEDAVGTWTTMRDEKVRDTHVYLEGQQIHPGERFYTYDDDSARFPGDFDKAENNVNCRCAVVWTISPYGA